MLKTTFGGGSISPAVAGHLKKSVGRGSAIVVAPVTVKQIGGGSISPSVASHLAKKKQIGGGSISPSVAAHLAKQKQFGGGGISPSVAAHLAKRNITKKWRQTGRVMVPGPPLSPALHTIGL